MIILNRDIFRLIVQHNLLRDPHCISKIKTVSTFFNGISEEPRSVAAFLVGLYGGRMAYHCTAEKHPELFTIPIIECIRDLISEKMFPRDLLRVSVGFPNVHKHLLNYFQSKPIERIPNTDDDVSTFEKILEGYCSESQILSRKIKLEQLSRFLRDSLWVPAMAPFPFRLKFINKFPSNLILDEPKLSKYMLINSGFGERDINTAIVVDALWEIGKKTWISNEERAQQLEIFLQLGGFHVDLDSVKEIVRRNSWVDTCCDFLKYIIPIDLLQTAVKQVIAGYLTDDFGLEYPRYQCAVTLANRFNVPFEFVEDSWSNGMGKIK